MRLTTFSDYTLRVLIYLGVRTDELATIGEIAVAYAVSRNHLMKVVHHLGRCGYVETVRGKGGGIRLGRAASRINIGEVVRTTERDTVLVECFDVRHSGCRIERACVLRGAFARATEAFYRVLDNYTLADLVQPDDMLREMLFGEADVT